MEGEERSGIDGSWATITVAPQIVLKLTILERRHSFIFFMGLEARRRAKGSPIIIDDCARYLYELYLETLPYLEGKGELKVKMALACKSSDINMMEEAFELWSLYMYEKGLVK